MPRNIFWGKQSLQGLCLHQASNALNSTETNLYCCQVVEMNLISFNSFSNAWFWFTLISLWAVFSQMYFGLSYNQLRLARSQHPERQAALLKALELYIERASWAGGQELGSSFAGAVAFLVSFWAVTAFYYDIELLQALFILAVPFTFSFIWRWRLVKKLAKDIPDFEKVFCLIRKIRICTLVCSLLTIFFSAFWGVRMILNDYSF